MWVLHAITCLRLKVATLPPNPMRGFLPGFGYQMGVLFSSAIPALKRLSRARRATLRQCP
jgi:hypothetical protein